MEAKPIGIVVKKSEARVDMGRLTRMSKLLRKWNVPKLGSETVDQEIKALRVLDKS